MKLDNIRPELWIDVLWFFGCVVITFLILRVVVHSIVYGNLQFVSRKFRAYKITKEMNQAHEEEDSEALKKAEVDLVYSNLEDISDPSIKPTQKRAKLKYVMEYGLPASNEQVALLVKSLTISHSLDLQAEIACYLCSVASTLVKTNNTKSSPQPTDKVSLWWIFRVSIWLTLLATLYYVFDKLDLLKSAELLLISFLFTVSLFASIISTKRASQISFAVVGSLGIVIIMMAAYSFFLHRGTQTVEYNSNGLVISADYPKWIGADSFEKDGCSNPVILKIETRRRIKINYAYDSANFRIKDSKCENWIEPKFTLRPRTGSTFAFYMLPKSESVLENEHTSLVVSITETGKTNEIKDLSYDINLEPQIWKMTRSILFAYTGATTLIQALIIILQKRFEQSKK